MRILPLLLFSLACASPALAHAEPASPTITARPRVALVLSGGGARGGAHIGVLKVLEEMHVPVDIIVGTSAGAIVGAAYASGMPLADIEREMQTLSTASLFHDVARRDLSIARKSDDAGSYVGPEIGIGPGGLSLPKGAVSGVALEALLRRLTVRQANSDFNRLPIPFRAIATDVSNGEMVVLDHGNLAQAVRASMAIPAVISPVEIDGQLLVDGGIARNLPVDVARAMGANVIIAINIGSPLLRRDQIKSVLSMSEQMTRMLTASNLRTSLAELNPQVDVLITPDLADVDAASFDLLKEAEGYGEQAARQATGKLRRYAVPANDYAVLSARRHGARAPEGVLLSAVHIDGTQRVPEASLRGTMETQAGDQFDAAKAERDMRRLFGRGDFEHVSYALTPRPDGSHEMTTTVNEKSWGPQYLRLGLGISTDFEGDSFFTLRAMHRWTWLNALGAEWRNDLAIGHTDRISTEWLQPLTPAQRLFASGYLSGERTPLDIYSHGERLARYRNESVAAGVDLGAPLAEWGEARIGVTRGHVKLLPDTSFVPPSELFPRARTGGLQARLRADTLDDRTFPRSGVEADLRVYASRTAMGADSNYNKLSFSALGAFATGPHSLQGAVEIQHKLGGNSLPDHEIVSFGGFLRMSGYRTGELVGNSLHFGRLVYNYRLTAPGLLNGAYVGASAELGRMGNTIDAQDGEQTVRSNALYIAIDTPLGPLYFGAGRASRNQTALYLLIGKP
ncbi:patatin-like phospholipase family protein [Duganella vulcania]|uniref:BamA/TamA family outer membrane protein n=1 Tax=Duganella vulcania TaxID=2692166 RepID=A0A845GLB0_9BURK|nr:patatin-like phospholipase family protein [Duganella vulcania]MYM94156.1 BamA/TamA family outer membrane protein [Duganella vulcania]